MQPEPTTTGRIGVVQTMPTRRSEQGTQPVWQLAEAADEAVAVTTKTQVMNS